MAAVNVNDTSLDPFSSRHGSMIGVVVLGTIAGSMVFVGIVIGIVLKLREKMKLRRVREGHYAYGQRATNAVNQAPAESTLAGTEVEMTDFPDDAIARNAVRQGSLSRKGAV